LAEKYKVVEQTTCGLRVSVDDTQSDSSVFIDWLRLRRVFSTKNRAYIARAATGRRTGSACITLRTKLFVLDVLLLLALCAVIQTANAGWHETKAKRQNVFRQEVSAISPLHTVSTPRSAASASNPEAAQATQYAEITARNLFSSDRNPNMVVDPPKVEEPRRMPPLPLFYGVLELPSGIKAIMSVRSGVPAQSVHAGEMIGEFRIVALDSRDVIFDWQGKQIPKRIEDLIDRSGFRADEQFPAPTSPLTINTRAF
jgi:hypothetical protein